MKAKATFFKINNSFFLFGILSTLLISCGSYQNSSYYDNDGIYGSSKPQEREENKYSEQNLEQSNQYASKFKSMQNEYDYFTDVENYSSNDNDTVVTVYNNEYNNQDYAGWGNNSREVTINYYNNSNWGMNNWGWNSWYGNNWGMNNWGWNSWYGNNWGWNNWGGYYNPNYYYGNYYNYGY